MNNILFIVLHGDFFLSMFLLYNIIATCRQKVLQEQAESFKKTVLNAVVFSKGFFLFVIFPPPWHREENNNTKKWNFVMQFLQVLVLYFRG